MPFVAAALFNPATLAALGAAAEYAAVATAGVLVGVGIWEGGKVVANQMSKANDDARDKTKDAVTDETCKDCKKRKEHWHHEMPQKFRDKFAKAGIDIDSPLNGRVMPGSEHLSMHGQGYNNAWADFFDANPNANAAQIMQQRDMIVTEYGLEAYRRPSGRYPQI